jgi:hypothetical protein
MKKIENLLRGISVILGLASIVFFVFDYLLFSKLRPKMVHFETISGVEEGLMSCVEIGFVLFLVFCLLSLWQIAKYLKNARKITTFSLFLITSGILSLVFIFVDIALLGDIYKQYQGGLSQPEWSMLYPILAFQLVTATVLTYLHLSGFLMQKQLKHIMRDSNIFLSVQYVGVICGLMGLSFSSLGFIFSRSWNLNNHTTMSSIVLLSPYFMAVIFWLITKFRENDRQWFDEKQLQDIGRSSILTLLSSVIFTSVLFVANYNNLNGIVSILWLPLYLFFVLLLFSLGNLYFSNKV